MNSKFQRASVFVAMLLLVGPLLAADTLPQRISDNAFWKMIQNLSEPSGAFPSDNLVSNEILYQDVIPGLQAVAKPGGVYIGVGPEQNFTYIAALQPKVAFIIDIRRENMLVHLLDKALFELSANRAEYLERLFSRARDSRLNDTSTASELLAAFMSAPQDQKAFQKNLRDVNGVLLKKHGFRLSNEDQTSIEGIYTAFFEAGPKIDYNAGIRGRGNSDVPAIGELPTYAQLMTAAGPGGVRSNYLATEQNYRIVRDLEVHNLIVPVVGDFGGPKTIRAIGTYLKEHHATVTAFYTSNVEEYLFTAPLAPPAAVPPGALTPIQLATQMIAQAVAESRGTQNGGWRNFYDSIATLPLDASSTFIRGKVGNTPNKPVPSVLASMQQTLAALRAGSITSYPDLFR